MNSFKLLHLPWLTFQVVIKTMDFIPLFNLSLVSNRMFLNIKLARRKVLPIHLYLKEKAHWVKITDEKAINEEKPAFKLCFYFWKNAPDEVKENYQIRKVKFGGLGIEVGKKSNHPESVKFCGNLNENFFDFFRRLLDLFAYPGLFVYIEKPLISEKFLANLVDFNIFSVLTSSEECYIWSEQDLSMLLDYTKPKLQLILKCPLVSDFYDKSILNYPRVRILNAQWLKIEDVMTANYSTIILCYHNFTENDMKLYIQHWLSGNNQTLTRFQCRTFENTPDWDEILKDVEYSKWDEKRRSRYHIFNSIERESTLDCKEGLDFERSDGKLASVFQNSNGFGFVVWHHRFQ